MSQMGRFEVVFESVSVGFTHSKIIKYLLTYSHHQEDTKSLKIILEGKYISFLTRKISTQQLNQRSPMVHHRPSPSEILQETRRNMAMNPGAGLPSQTPYSSNSILDPNLWRGDESSFAQTQMTHPSTRMEDNK